MPIVVQLDFRIIVFIKNEEKMTNDETFQGALWIRVDSPTSQALQLKYGYQAAVA
jgi:hypothetical protein